MVRSLLLCLHRSLALNGWAWEFLRRNPHFG
ncbi:transcriptional regulator domain-containing protein [Mesorhizobium sp. LjNodule214]